MSKDVSETGPLGAGLVFFGAIVVLIGIDLITDYGAGTPPLHVGAEFLILIISLAGVLLLWGEFRTARRMARALEIDVESARAEAAHWREEAQDLLDGLRVAVHRQFDRWQLTTAEREVALLLLQGLGHKQIAGARGTSERTVREQSRSVYQKAGLAGRSELAAFFLGDVFETER